jgi:hypothetical protein
MYRNKENDKKDKKSVFVKKNVFVGFWPIETLRFNLK